MKWLVCLLTFASAAAAEQPFWRAKEKAYKRIREGEILVSVATVPNPAPPPKNALRAAGGGVVAAPRAFVFETASDYERIARTSDYVKSVRYNAATSAVTIEMEAFGHKGHFVVEVHAHPGLEPMRIEYKIIEGPLAGMSGEVNFTNLGRACEVGFTGEFKGDEFPIPRVFLEFGFEVILQKMAARVRAYAEEEWRTSLPKARPVDRRKSLWNNPPDHEKRGIFHVSTPGGLLGHRRDGRCPPRQLPALRRRGACALDARTRALADAFSAQRSRIGGAALPDVAL